MNYQGVARDAGGSPLTNQNIGLRLSINSAYGFYQETHSTTTSDLGLFSVALGDGTTSDDFSSIQWADTTHSLTVELSPNNDGTYQSMGTTQFKMVPYAAFAKSAPGNTLNEAYNRGGAGAGRVIEANNGEVVIEGTDGFLVTGSHLLGDAISQSGAGTRMFFNPKKSAFRAGRVTGNSWNNSNVGDYSFAIGYNTEASGSTSVAAGFNSTASGTYSIAMGFTCNALGANSVAIGDNTEATGEKSVALGYGVDAIGEKSIAIGDFTDAIGAHSTAMGNLTTASGKWSTAMGNNTLASGEYSTAMGEHTTAKSSHETVIGRYNTDYTPVATTSWSSLDRLLVVGNGAASNDRSDAMVVLKNGNTGFGTSTPTSRLHVADGNIYADRNLDGTGVSRTLTLAGKRTGNGSHYTGLEMRNEDGFDYLGAAIRSFNADGFESGDLRFYTRDGFLNGFLTEGFRVTHQSDVYVPEPGAAIVMTSPDGTCWELTVSNAGALTVTESLTCP